MKNLSIKLALFINYFVFAALLNSVGLLIQKSQNVYDVLPKTASLLEPAKDLTIALKGNIKRVYSTTVIDWKKNQL